MLLVRPLHPRAPCFERCDGFLSFFSLSLLFPSLLACLFACLPFFSFLVFSFRSSVPSVLLTIPLSLPPSIHPSALKFLHQTYTLEQGVDENVNYFEIINHLSIYLYKYVLFHIFIFKRMNSVSVSLPFLFLHLSTCCPICTFIFIYFFICTFITLYIFYLYIYFYIFFLFVYLLLCIYFFYRDSQEALQVLVRLSDNDRE